MKTWLSPRGELRHILRAFFYYRRGFLYLKMRFFIAPCILRITKPLEKPKTRADFSMHMFFGKRDFLMGLWSLASFYRVMPELGELFLHSDGTLDDRHRAVLRRLFPSARIEDAREFMAKHGRLLDMYPVLKRFRETYTRFQVRIVDQHFLSGKKYRLFIDSDLLWFREPREIVETLRSGIPTPLMMSNATCVRMTFRDGRETDDVISRPNGGIAFYREDQFNIARATEFLEKSDYRGKRFGDQPWLAWILRPALLPEDTYIIKGAITERVVVRHYTAPQRPKFYLLGLNLIWRAILEPYVRH